MLLTLVVLSAFGPYVFRGVRTDQIAVYGAAALLLPVLWPRIRTTPAVAAIIAAWLLLIATAIITWVDPPMNHSGYKWGPAAASLDNLVLPLTVLLLTLVVVTPQNREHLLRRVCAVVVVGMCANAVVGLAQTQLALDGILRRWWVGEGGFETTAERALTLGRYTGVIGQPALAGVLYGIALLCAIYWLHGRSGRLIATVVLLTVGGVLTVSKAFLLVGLPIAFWHLLRASGSGRPRRIMLMFGAGVGFYVAALWGAFGAWSGATRLMGLVPNGDPDQFGIGILTGNRYGGSSTTWPLAQTVLEREPLTGYGLAGLATATDSAWVHSLVLAGLVGVTTTALILLAVAAGYQHRKRRLTEPERRLFGGLVILLVACSFGFPVLTGNRLAVVVWLLLTLLLSMSARDRQVTAAVDTSRMLVLPAPSR